MILSRLRFFARRAVVGLIRLYQLTLAPVFPLVLGPGCGCRFHPTCSHYAAEAVQVHGIPAGLWLTVRRLLRCQPLHPGGFDPVPPARRTTPVCYAADNPRAASPSFLSNPNG